MTARANATALGMSTAAPTMTDNVPHGPIERPRKLIVIADPTVSHWLMDKVEQTTTYRQARSIPSSGSNSRDIEVDLRMRLA